MTNYRCVECEQQWSSESDVAPACPNNCATQPIQMPNGDETLPMPDPGFDGGSAPSDPLDDPTPTPPSPPPHRCCGR